MSFTQVTMYRVMCDRCGVHADDAGDYFAWADKDQAITEAEEMLWLIRADGHWCPGCVTYDGEHDAYIPKPVKEAS